MEVDYRKCNECHNKNCNCESPYTFQESKKIEEERISLRNLDGKFNPETF